MTNNTQQDAMKLREIRRNIQILNKGIIGEGVTASGIPTRTSKMRGQEREILRKYEDSGRNARCSPDPKKEVRNNYPRPGSSRMDKYTKKAFEDMKEAFKKGYREL